MGFYFGDEILGIQFTYSASPLNSDFKKLSYGVPSFTTSIADLHKAGYTTPLPSQPQELSNSNFNSLFGITDKLLPNLVGEGKRIIAIWGCEGDCLCTLEPNLPVTPEIMISFHPRRDLILDEEEREWLESVAGLTWEDYFEGDKVRKQGESSTRWNPKWF